MSAEKFPPRILALLHEVADRVGTEFRGPFEDGNGDPLQDDADAALEWIDAAEAGQEAAAVQAAPVRAYMTLDEEGSPAMLFFDKQEALNYCDVDEEPIPLVAALSGSLGDGGGKG